MTYQPFFTGKTSYAAPSKTHMKVIKLHGCL